MKKLTLKKIKEVVSQIDDQIDDADAGYKAMVVLLSSINIGPNADKLAKFTKYPRSLVRQFGRRLRNNGVWIGDKVAAVEWFEEGGSVALIADSLVALGLVRRTSVNKKENV